MVFYSVMAWHDLLWFQWMTWQQHNCVVGAFVGCSLEGSIVKTRMQENSRFYGRPSIKTSDILLGSLPRPPAAAILYHALADLYKKHGRWLVWVCVDKISTSSKSILSGEVYKVLWSCFPIYRSFDLFVQDQAIGAQMVVQHKENQKGSRCWKYALWWKYWNFWLYIIHIQTIKILCWGKRLFVQMMISRLVACYFGIVWISLSLDTQRQTISSFIFLFPQKVIILKFIWIANMGTSQVLFEICNL